MLLCEYSIWDSTRWDRVCGKVIVQSKKQWKEWLEKNHPRAFRSEPYTDGEDSLEVDFKKITLPFEL